MLVSSVLDSVKGKLRQRGETGNFTDAALCVKFNDCLLTICDDLQFYKVKVSIPTDDDGRVYLPSDCLRLENVSYNGQIIPPIGANAAAVYSNTAAAPYSDYGYEFVNGYLQFRPTPGTPLVFRYIARVLPVDNVDEDVDLREEYRMALVFGILADCFTELKDWDSAGAAQANYEKELAKRRRTIRDSAWKGQSAPNIPPVYV